MANSNDRVSGEVVQLAYTLVPVGLIATAINSTIIVILHWRLVPRRLLWTWIGSLGVISIIRAGTVWFFRRRKACHLSNETWTAILVSGLIGSGVIWGTSALFMRLHASLPHQILVVFILGGMTAGAAATFSSLRGAYYGFVVPALIPQMVLLFAERDMLYYAIGGMLALYGVLMVFVAETNGSIVRSSFRLRFEREDLVAALQTERDRLERNYAQLQDEIARREGLEQDLRTAQSDLEQKVEDRTAQLSSANEKLIEANNELAAFTHSVSHDLRAPLQAVKTVAGIIEENYEASIDDQGRQYLSALQKTTGRMQEIVEDLLTLSRVSQAHVEKHPVNLSLIAQDILQTLRKRDPDRVVNTVVEPDCMTDGDTRLLRIVLENLLGNAWKFTARTSGAWIEFGRMERDGAAPEFFVRDNGAGFDMAFADRLFHPFQRLHTDRDFPGTGIGLATVERIIRKHGGKIRAEAEPGKGATFFFSTGAK